MPETTQYMFLIRTILCGLIKGNLFDHANRNLMAITSGDYAVLHDAAGHMSDSAYESSISTLEKVDFNNIDTIVVDYNAQDYLDGRIGMNPDDPKDEVTYKGALSSGIAQIQETYPHIRIVCMTLTYCFAYNSEGKTMKGRDERLLQYDNARVFYFQTMEETLDLDNYADYSHYKPAINKFMVECFKDGKYEIRSVEEMEDGLSTVRKMVADYDFAELFSKEW